MTGPKKSRHLKVSTHSRLKAAGEGSKPLSDLSKVSTHSRLKAAGRVDCVDDVNHQGFNTQPPEGGWIAQRARASSIGCFNTQPPEGGWQFI